MQQSTAAMQVALRVLEAITARRHPEEADVGELRQLAPLLADMPPDELACAVIKQAIERLEDIRRKRDDEDTSATHK